MRWYGESVVCSEGLRGAARPMLAAFLEDAVLSAEDIAELKKILEQKVKE